MVSGYALIKALKSCLHGAKVAAVGRHSRGAAPLTRLRPNRSIAPAYGPAKTTVCTVTTIARDSIYFGIVAHLDPIISAPDDVGPRVEPTECSHYAPQIQKTN